MHDLIAIFLGFILTGLIGNRLLQDWQHRIWIRQQQFLGQEKQYTALKQLSEELSAIMGARLYAMKRLRLAILSLNIDEMEVCLKDYNEVLNEWNKNLNGYYVKLALYAEYSRAHDLESRIQKRFYSCGQQLESLVRKRRSGDIILKSDCTALLKEMNQVQARIFGFNRDILSIAENVRRRVFFGEKLYYKRENISRFSNHELIKSLFVSNVDTHAVFRASINSGLPQGRR